MSVKEYDEMNLLEKKCHESFQANFVLNEIENMSWLKVDKSGDGLFIDMNIAVEHFFQLKF